MREIELYERVKEADTREKAIELGAEDAVAQLEADFFKTGGDRDQTVAQWKHGWNKQDRSREDETTLWDHLRNIAIIKQSTETALEKARSQSSVEVEHIRLANDIDKIRLHNEIEQAHLIQDEDVRREREPRLRQNDAEANQRDQELHRARHQNAYQEIELGTLARRNEFQRIQEYEDKQSKDKIKALDRIDSLENAKTGAEINEIGRVARNKDLEDKHAALNRVIAMQAERDRQELELKEREREAEWQRELQRRKVDNDARVQDMKAELERIAAIGNLSVAGQVAISTDGRNASALVELAKIDAFKGMNAEQIMAVSLQHSPHAADVLKAKYAQPTTSQDVSSAEKHLIQEQMARQDALNRERNCSGTKARNVLKHSP